jgi:hypothetical protein
MREVGIILENRPMNLMLMTPFNKRAHERYLFAEPMLLWIQTHTKST